jgi:hypothetical protein
MIKVAMDGNLQVTFVNDMDAFITWLNDEDGEAFRPWIRIDGTTFYVNRHAVMYVRYAEE